MSLPGPNATREEVERYMRDAEERRARQRRSAGASHAGSTCSSCGVKGHRRGIAACPNYGTPWRWGSKGQRYYDVHEMPGDHR